MVRHVILWKLKEMPDAEKAAVKAGIKEGLEGLAGKIPGLLDVRVYTDALPSSANADLMLDTTFTDAAALKGYSTHPAHDPRPRRGGGRQGKTVHRGKDVLGF